MSFWSTASRTMRAIGAPSGAESWLATLRSAEMTVSSCRAFAIGRPGRSETSRSAVSRSMLSRGRAW